MDQQGSDEMGIEFEPIVLASAFGKAQINGE